MICLRFVLWLSGWGRSLRIAEWMGLNTPRLALCWWTNILWKSCGVCFSCRETIFSYFSNYWLSRLPRVVRTMPLPCPWYPCFKGNRRPAFGFWLVCQVSLGCPFFLYRYLIKMFSWVSAQITWTWFSSFSNYPNISWSKFKIAPTPF